MEACDTYNDITLDQYTGYLYVINDSVMNKITACRLIFINFCAQLAELYNYYCIVSSGN